MAHLSQVTGVTIQLYPLILGGSDLTRSCWSSEHPRSRKRCLTIFCHSLSLTILYLRSALLNKSLAKLFPFISSLNSTYNLIAVWHFKPCHFIVSFWEKNPALAARRFSIYNAMVCNTIEGQPIQSLTAPITSFG